MKGVNKRQKVSVNKKQAEYLKEKVHKFDEIFQKEQGSFQKSNETEYYIVSTSYIEQWREFCLSNQPQRQEPITLNQDLMDQGGGQLRLGLSESSDFQIVNQAIFKLLRSGSGFELKRQAYFVGSQKKVQVYQASILYLQLSSNDLKSIDYNRLKESELEFKTLQISRQATLSEVALAIKKQNKFSKDISVRLWKNSKTVTITKLYKYIKEKCKPLTGFYRIDGIGKLMENDSHVLSDLEFQEGDYFIAQCIDKYQDWFFKSPSQAKCQGCYKYKKLPFPCGCKKVAYCTQECQEKDKRYHLRDCSFAQQEELNKKIEMVITKQSRLGNVGLSNLGNTCFMSSCLQCLSNTIPLTNYFIKSYYEGEINKENPLGTKGKLVKSYAKFIKNMWCASESTFSPYNLKSAVSSINPMFSGYAQHDSQQFFSFLIDGIHEDLNRVIKKPYVESVESKGRKDSQVALESWIAYTQRNQSIITDLMTGQYKSKVVCPDCDRESITFDPFTTVSLPIPQEAVPGTLKYYVIFNNCTEEALKMSFQYKKSDPSEWLKTATSILKRSPQDFVFYILTLYESIYPFESTSKSQILHKIQVDSKNAFLLELSPEEKKIKNKITLVSRFCKKSYYGDDYDNLWFKRPFFFEKQGLTGFQFYNRILDYIYSDVWDKSKSRSMISGYSLEQFRGKMLKERPFSLVLKYKKTIESYYHRVEITFKEEQKIKDDTNIPDLLKKLSTEPNDCQIDIRFSKEALRQFSFERLKKFDDKTQRYAKQSSQNVIVSLEQCFRVFEEKQKLDPGNQWYCSNCKDHKLATKQITIYKAPQILILHLKRFKSKGILRKQKNDTTVTFPTTLDIKNYAINPTPMTTYISDLKKNEKYLKPSFDIKMNNSDKTEYELFAVSNHYGGLGGGHYTAFAKNNGRWYDFNDSSVKEVSAESIKGSGAYMLFYKRKQGLTVN